jgi:tetratricopeptide (TPR) repeat protein
MRAITRHVVLLSAVFCSAFIFAQAASSFEKADQLAAQGKWSAAADAYKDIVSATPDEGRAWEGLGESSLQTADLPSAIRAFSRAVQLNYRPLVNQVNIGRAYAKQGATANAIASLRELLNNPNASAVRRLVSNAPEFSDLKYLEAFQQIAAALQPCNKPVYRQFDFWAGDWDVQTPAGKPVGHNRVTVEQDGCLLVEHWVGNGGASGTSFNYYDVRDSKWHQLYIDNSGNAGAFPAMAGSLVDSKMVLLSDATSVPLLRWTWYVVSPGRVRQMAERSEDAGKSWRTFWDSVYISTTAGATVPHAP